MENKRLRQRTGTVAVGAIAIIAVFMIVLTCIGIVVMESNRYNMSVKYANEAVATKTRESLAVVQTSNTLVNVTNEGSTPVVIIGFYRVNPADNNPNYVPLSNPATVPLLSSASITLPQATPENWKVSVVTSLGNVFWEEAPVQGGATQTVPPGEPAYVTFAAQGLGSDASGTILTVDGTAYSYSQLPKTFQWVSGSTHSFAWSSPVSGSSGVRYLWVSTSGLSTKQSDSSFTVNANGYVIATYKTQYSLTMNVNPTGGGTTNPAPGTYWYDPGSTVQISATASSGYSFSSWAGSGSGSYSGTANPASVTVNGPITETANFAPLTATVTFAVSGLSPDASSTVLTVDDVGYAYSQLPKSFTWNVGSTHTFAWTDPVSSTTSGKRYAWVSTSGLSTARSGTITVLTSGSVSATYKTQFLLTVSTGMLKAADYGSAPWGTTPSFPDSSADWIWRTSGAASDAPVEGYWVVKYFSLTASETITTFITCDNYFTLYIDGNQIGSGSDWTRTYSFQTSLAAGIHQLKLYVGNQGGPAGLIASVKASSEQILFNTQQDNTWLLLGVGSSAGTTNPTPGEYWCDASSTVSISATANSGYAFTSWAGSGSGSYTGTANPATITMNGPITETAVFSSWLTGWSYRRPITITSTTSLSNYQILIQVDTASLISAGKMRSDGGDIRFTDSDGVTLLNYWIEPGTINTANTRIWVKVSSIQAGSKTIYLYYRNPSATSQSNGDATFLFFDDFSGTSLDLNKWNQPPQTTYVGYTIENGKLVLYVGTRGKSKVWNVGTSADSKNQYSLSNTIIEAYVSMVEGGSTYPAEVGGQLGIRLWDGSAGWGFGRQLFVNNAWLRIYSGAEKWRTGSWNGAQTPYKILAIAKVGSTTYFMEDGVVQTSRTDISLASSRVSIINYVGNAWGNGWGEVYVDWVRVRNYVTPEPTVTVGSEQSG